MELIYTIIAILCMCLGFYTGYKVGKDKDLPKIPKELVHPIKTIKENLDNNKDEKEQNEKLEKLQEDLAELDAYDGGLGVPERR